jgi:hypothetical protein
LASKGPVRLHDLLLHTQVRFASPIALQPSLWSLLPGPLSLYSLCLLLRFSLRNYVDQTDEINRLGVGAQLQETVTCSQVQFPSELEGCDEAESAPCRFHF